MAIAINAGTMEAIASARREMPVCSRVLYTAAEMTDANRPRDLDEQLGSRGRRAAARHGRGGERERGGGHGSPMGGPELVDRTLRSSGFADKCKTLRDGAKSCERPEGCDD